MARKAKVGSISSGTMRTEDLLDALSFELNYLLGKEATEDQRQLIAEANSVDPDTKEASDILSELFSALEELAPAYCSFGAHPDDGSDYGFWPIIECIEELPRVESSDEAIVIGEDCFYVNDHGNLTVYGADGSVILELV